MRIIAVDDEQLQLEAITEYLTEFYPEAQVVGFTKASQVIAYMDRNTVDVAVLDISLPGRINGIGLGDLLRKKNPRVRLLYCTGYSEYAIDAFKMHANGYLQKPVAKEALERELRYIIQMPVFDPEDKPYIQTFGNFDLFAKGRPVVIQRSKSKEVLAWLTNRKGGWVSNRELATVLWEGDRPSAAMAKYISTLVRELEADLARAGCGHILERQWGKVRLRTAEVSCDYYGYLQGDEAAKNAFSGEYMAQYSWGEGTLAMLLRESNLKK